MASDQAEGWLRTYCGLRVVPAYKSRLADTDVAARGCEWDGRFLTSVIGGWVPPAQDSFKFIVYGGASYTQPIIIEDRKLSPTKESPKAQYFAVLEYTSVDKWYETWRSESGKKRRGLLGRLEQRLFVVKDRAQSSSERPIGSITDVVAVVGVAGSYPCNSDVERILSRAKAAEDYPLLTAMFKAGRFVFFIFSAVAASPKVVGAASIAGSAATSVSGSKPST